MNRSLKTVALGLLAVTAILSVGVAQARSNVYWSIDINVPVVYPQPVFVAPSPVVYAPPPVVYVPRPVYVQPRSVYYYAEPVYYNGERLKHRHRHHEHDDDD